MRNRLSMGVSFWPLPVVPSPAKVQQAAQTPQAWDAVPSRSSIPASRPHGLTPVRACPAGWTDLRATMERPLQLRDAGKRISLRGLGPNDVNSLELPQRVAPKTELVDTGQLTHLRVAPYSLTVLALDFE